VPGHPGDGPGIGPSWRLATARGASGCPGVRRGWPGPPQLSRLSRKAAAVTRSGVVCPVVVEDRARTEFLGRLGGRSKTRFVCGGFEVRDVVWWRLVARASLPRCDLRRLRLPAPAVTGSMAPSCLFYVVQRPIGPHPAAGTRCAKRPIWHITVATRRRAENSSCFGMSTRSPRISVRARSSTAIGESTPGGVTVAKLRDRRDGCGGSG
jgi:ribosomal protein L34E